MNFEMFIKEVKKEVKTLVGEECSVSVNCVMKINRELQGITILQRGTSISPSVYLEDYYKEYQSGRSINEIATEIVSISKQRKHNMVSMAENLQDYQWVKPRLRVKLINYDRNEKLLQTSPHERFLDLAILPYVVLMQEDDIMTTRVPLTLLTTWGIDQATVLMVAKENTLMMNPVVIEEMTDFILHMILKEFNTMESDRENDREEMLKALLGKDTKEKEMYIITNERNLDGAYAAFQTKELATLSDKIGTGKLYILPSSIHELLAIPAAGIEPDKLRDMVKDINCTQVPEEDFLSDTIYEYDRLRNEISLVL